MKRPARSFDTLTAAVRAFRDERDWRKFHTPKDLALSIGIEAAELMEHFQWKSDEEARAYLTIPENRAAVAKELADILILVLSAGDVVGADLHETTLAKLRENAAKYPVAKA